MRKTFIALLFCLGAATPALAEVRVSIGINVPAYPTLQRIPNYPVYYAPSLRANYFFYDGLYWVFEGDEWYASTWYNGPWHVVDRFQVPVYLLRVPVRYYRSAPVTFRSWRADAPPRWHDYWGGSWASRRAGWDRWDVRSSPAPAPLPVYQRQYTRERYPRVEEQVVIQSRNYRYEPRDQVAREVFRERRVVAERRDNRDNQSQPRGHIRTELDRGGRGPPDHAVAKGLRNRDDDDDRRGKAKGHDRDRDDDRGRGRGRDKDKD